MSTSKKRLAEKLPDSKVKKYKKQKKQRNKEDQSDEEWEEKKSVISQKRDGWMTAPFASSASKFSGSSSESSKSGVSCMLY